MLALLLFGLFTVLMMLRVTVGVSLLASTICGLFYAGFGDALYIIPQQTLDGVNSSVLVAVAFFILTGNLMTAVGMTDRIFAFAQALVGHMKAGLAQVNVVASVVFSGINGSAVADCASLGTILIRAMREKGYPAPFSCALTVASSMIGPTLPPSIPLVIYAAAASTSLQRLFLAAIIPGFLLAAALMIYNWIVADRMGFPRASRRATLREIWPAMVRGFSALVAPLIILGALTYGFATPTEAGALAAAYTLLLGLAYRTLTFQNFTRAVIDTALMTGFAIILIGFSMPMAWLLAIEQVPQALSSSILTVTDSQTLFLANLLIFLLVLGMFVEPIPAMVILIPMLMPIVDQFGVDRVQFGVLFTFGLTIGLATPPVGIVLYIVSEIAQVSFEKVAIATLPFLIPLIIVLVLITFIPGLTLWLPDLILGVQK